ncbi:hypothetical protein GCM10011401_04250 [Nesterenkonia cremea]|uniref:YtxH domain-containing protein n=2 Tax=Nesterenkonia cremea TaxID=1882340 RepID=A0A917AMB4_9MICC|nr:hypothetical protein GCM10011401_04250 [Nesterenkonia cremea]
MIMGLLSLGAGVAIGYVIGTKSGQKSFDSFKRTAEEKWNDPKVQDAVRKAEETANSVAHDVAGRAKEAVTAASGAIKDGLSEATDAAADAEQKVDEAAAKAEDTVEEAEEKIDEKTS